MIFITGRLNRRLTVRDAKGIVGIFSPASDEEYGYFVTEDGDLVERIKQTALYRNNEIREYSGGKPKFEEFIQGSGGFAEISGLLNKVQDNPQRKPQTDYTPYIRFGELKANLLKKDGSYRRDATEEDITEYETLKEKLGV